MGRLWMITWWSFLVGFHQLFWTEIVRFEASPCDISEYPGMQIRDSLSRNRSVFRKRLFQASDTC